jgi:hypothetical protein
MTAKRDLILVGDTSHQGTTITGTRISVPCSLWHAEYDKRYEHNKQLMRGDIKKITTDQLTDPDYWQGREGVTVLAQGEKFGSWLPANYGFTWNRQEHAFTIQSTFPKGVLWQDFMRSGMSYADYFSKLIRTFMPQMVDVSHLVTLNSDIIFTDTYVHLDLTTYFTYGYVASLDQELIEELDAGNVLEMDVIPYEIKPLTGTNRYGVDYSIVYTVNPENEIISYQMFVKSRNLYVTSEDYERLPYHFQDGKASTLQSLIDIAGTIQDGYLQTSTPIATVTGNDASLPGHLFVTLNDSYFARDVLRILKVLHKYDAQGILSRLLAGTDYQSASIQFDGYSHQLQGEGLTLAVYTSSQDRYEYVPDYVNHPLQTQDAIADRLLRDLSDQAFRHTHDSDQVVILKNNLHRSINRVIKLAKSN